MHHIIFFNFIVLFFIVTNATEKRQRDIGGTSCYSKRQLTALLAGDKGYEDRRGTPVRFQGFTIHGSNKIEHDTMEHYEGKLRRLIEILGGLLERKIIEGWVATIEYWDEKETENTKYLERSNYHIHFFIIASMFFIKPQWYQFYRRIFGEILEAVDYTCESCFHMSYQEIYGIAYCIAYLYKRQEWYTPKYGGICNDLYIREMLKQHRENPIEYQVDHGKEHPQGIDRYLDPHMMGKASLIICQRLFYFKKLIWKRTMKVLTFINEKGDEYDYHHFCIALSNCDFMKPYHPWLESVFKRLKHPEYFLLKYKQV